MKAVMIILVFGVFVVIGCGNSQLNCTDAEIVDHVLKVAINDITMGGMVNTSLIKNPRIQSIRTQHVDKKTGGCFCAADFATDEGRWLIEYTAQRTEDDGKIYVQYERIKR